MHLRIDFEIPFNDPEDVVAVRRADRAANARQQDLPGATGRSPARFRYGVSFYRWQGKIADEPEYLMIHKSTHNLFPELRTEVEKHHSYSVPEVIALPIIDGAPNYLNWVTECVSASEG